MLSEWLVLYLHGFSSILLCHQVKVYSVLRKVEGKEGMDEGANEIRQFIKLW